MCVCVFSFYFKTWENWNVHPVFGPLIKGYGHTYIYICCEVIIWAKFGHFQSYYLGQVCSLKNTVCKKNYKIGFQHFFFWKKKVCTKISKVIIWAKLAIFMLQQLGPDNNINLAQIITLENGHFFLFFCFWKCAEIPIFTVFFEHQPKFCQKKAKNDNFSHFSKHRLLKKTFCCNSPFDQKLVFLNLCFFLKPKTLMLNRKHNWIPGKSKDKKKGFEREKQDRKP